MVDKALMRRVVAVEAMALPPKDMPRLFVTIEDAGVPDPDAQAQEPFAGDSDVIGATGQFRGRQVRVTRLPGESIAQLEARAQRLEPAIPLFFFCYASLPFSRAAFDAQQDADAAEGATANAPARRAV